MKTKHLKILCKKCHTDFEYKGNLDRSVEYVKCANIFKIVYGINILCPNCMAVVNPQIEKGKTIGVPVQEAAKATKSRESTSLKDIEVTRSRKARLAKKFKEVKKRFQLEKFEQDDIDEETKRQNKVKEIQQTIKERDAKTEATFGPRPKPFLENDRKETEISEPPKKIKKISKARDRESKKESKGWHIKITKKQRKFFKKIGFSLILLGFVFTIGQIVPEIISSKISYASFSSSQESPYTEIDHDEEMVNSDTTPSGALNIGKLHELLNRKKMEKDNKKEQKKAKPQKAAWVKKFSRYIARLNITSPYGFRKDPFTGKKRFHTGIDVPRRYRSPVKALMSGKVIFSGYKGGYGNLVIIRHKNGLTSYYGHNAKNTILKGDYVTKGKIIAYVGMTGRTTGPHLHFEVRKSGSPIDPVKFLRGLFKKQGRVTI